MRGGIRRRAAGALAAALAAALPGLACSQRPHPAGSAPPPAPTPTTSTASTTPPAEVSDGEVIRLGTTACGNAARDHGLQVLDVRGWVRTGEDRWDARLRVRPAGGGLEYEMACRYDARRDKATVARQ
jgi:hypothetical protein